ncbi:MAG: polysaccharide deacetylase family protein [Spirochaetes bacterium]|nr:polysaccharide deacetylase family protein [Spirochaetota bacterium]
MKRYLFITIDTEEDNWGDNTVAPTLENIYRIPRLQELFDAYSAVPTYLINYPVATDKKSVEILRAINKGGGCEIGAHCHPWNTPPLEEEQTPRNSFMHNLPPDLIRKKMDTLQAAIQKNFGIQPACFRAGRWGFNQNVAAVLRAMNYRVDSSMTPFCEWDDYDGGPIFGLRHNEMFYLNENDYPGFTNKKKMETRPNDGDLLLEVPPTIGFLQPYFAVASTMRNIFKRKIFAPFRVLGILEKLRFMNYRWLSPENSFVEDMIKLSRIILGRGGRFLNMFFHSTSLIPGKSPFIRSERDVDEMLKKIETYLKFTADENINCVGLSKAEEMMS